MGDRMEGETGPQTAGTAIMANVDCVTFNHADYIKAALDSFLMQKADSTFGILVHDDTSTDGTSSIIREYAARYPDQVKPLIQTENQYSQEIDNISGASNFPRVRGRYIFVYNGDDYFLSLDKLQRQVDYVKTCPDCALCIHSAKIDLMGRALTERQMRPYRESRVLPPERIIDKPSGYAMSSMAFPARLVRELPGYYVDCPVGDTPIQPIATANRYGYYSGDAMNTHQVGVTDSWAVGGKNGDYQGKQRAYCDRMRHTYEQLDRATEDKFKGAAESVVRRTYYQTTANTKQPEEIFNPQYRRYYKELTPRTRFLLRFEHIMPVVYGMARKTFTGKRFQ